jgi:hypothetical protein
MGVFDDDIFGPMLASDSAKDDPCHDSADNLLEDEADQELMGLLATFSKRTHLTAATTDSSFSFSLFFNDLVDSPYHVRYNPQDNVDDNQVQSKDDPDGAALNMLDSSSFDNGMEQFLLWLVCSTVVLKLLSWPPIQGSIE